MPLSDLKVNSFGQCLLRSTNLLVLVDIWILILKIEKHFFNTDPSLGETPPQNWLKRQLKIGLELIYVSSEPSLRWFLSLTKIVIKKAFFSFEDGCPYIN